MSYVTSCAENGSRYTPLGTVCVNAGELKARLKNCGGDIRKAIGNYNENAGVWIRFNPMSGDGTKNSDVTDHRYALIESDKIN